MIVINCVDPIDQRLLVTCPRRGDVEKGRRTDAIPLLRKGQLLLRLDGILLLQLDRLDGRHHVEIALRDFRVELELARAQRVLRVLARDLRLLDLLLAAKVVEDRDG